MYSPRSSLVILESMSDLSKDQLRKALTALGETPPSSWNRVELKLRLQELTGEDLSKTSKQLGQAEESEYQIWYKRLRSAMNKRKADLREFVEKELGLTNVDKFTVARLELAALQKIMEIAKPDGRDSMGFGRHSTDTYQQTFDNDPGYCQWILQTSREEAKTSDPRLLRFASWLEMKDQVELVPETRKGPKFLVPKNLAKDTSVSSSDGYSSASSSKMATQMEEMMKMMQTMKSELDDLKSVKQESLPRKKVDKNRANDSEDSFQVISRSGKGNP